MKRASYFTQQENKTVRCNLCPHHCRIGNNKHGICFSRENHDGILYAANYCRPISTAVDPIEKKPLYHFYPNSSIFSTGPNGCTFKCSFCQNWEISQTSLSPSEVKVNDLAKAVIRSKSKGIAFTYSEPYIWFETIMDLSTKIKEQGLVTVMVTNGYMEPEPLKELCTVIDAMNIDIKSMNPDFYRKYCKAELDPVLRTCETVAKHCHLEITNLLITEKNDSEEEIQKLVNYIAQNLGKHIPLHISRYFPRYQFRHPATPESTLYRAWDLASDKLDYVYLGNLTVKDKAHTFCPSCNKTLIRRNGYYTNITKNLHKEDDGKGSCKNCGKELYIRL